MRACDLPAPRHHAFLDRGRRPGGVHLLLHWEPHHDLHTRLAHHFSLKKAQPNCPLFIYIIILGMLNYPLRYLGWPSPISAGKVMHSHHVQFVNLPLRAFELGAEKRSINGASSLLLSKLLASHLEMLNGTPWLADAIATAGPVSPCPWEFLLVIIILITDDIDRGFLYECNPLVTRFGQFIIEAGMLFKQTSNKVTQGYYKVVYCELQQTWKRIWSVWFGFLESHFV